ncbi:hypothetical protein SCLCIDRAFT_33814 [Scleroderma citrinum Foug A]|uniref:Uncharacterized protein n=1 Tax=Scleroderma citrinum Foug A TaxID=1036808 RepID=A0A0C3D3L2_9AGAM|nr:hypothetical protein SCLCIDRAFT_33814 [Scleroderma citrinum Foug A]
MLPGRFVSLPFPVLFAPSLLPDFLPLPDWTIFLFLTFMALTSFVGQGYSLRDS